MLKWGKVIRGTSDIRNGYQLCPICKKDTLEILVKTSKSEYPDVLQERCSKGCYVFDFKKNKRIK